MQTTSILLDSNEKKSGMTVKGYTEQEQEKRKSLMNLFMREGHRYSSAKQQQYTHGHFSVAYS